MFQTFFSAHTMKHHFSMFRYFWKFSIFVFPLFLFVVGVHVTHQAGIFFQISVKKMLKIGEIRLNSSSQKIPGLMSYTTPPQKIRKKCELFSWFPGYTWQIIHCSECYSHLGWEFRASSRHLRPKSFYGLTQRSIISTTLDETANRNDQSEPESDETDPAQSLKYIFVFLTKILIYDLNINFWPTFRFWTTISIFDLNFNFIILTKILIFSQKNYFWTKLTFFD